MPRQSMGGTPVPYEKSFVFKMHLNPFKAILDQFFLMHEAQFILWNENGGNGNVRKNVHINTIFDC